MVTRAAILASLIMVFPGLSWANCEQDIKASTPKVKQIKDDKARHRAEDYLQRANRELQENDDFECASAIGAVTKIIEANPSK